MSKLIVRLVALGAALSGLAQADSLIFDRGLPNSTNVNINDPVLPRSNAAWLTGADATGFIIGDDFSFGADGTISSITVFDVANHIAGDGNSEPFAEFGNITLYVGASGAPLTNAFSSYTSTYVGYQPGTVNYLATDGSNFFPIYALTFSGLNLAVKGGTVYDFAVDATPLSATACSTSPFGDPCILSLHASNGLSGTPQQGADGEYLNFTLSGGAATFANACDGACQAGNLILGVNVPATDINIQIQGTILPEPGTLGTLGVGIAGLIAFARKRRK